jgi:glycosyltransferase involved in cell wall biosynthesis
MSPVPPDEVGSSPEVEDVPAPGSELPGLSGIVPTLNEEGNLEECLQSFQDICDEIIVVDSFSQDRTVEIARRFTDRVYQQRWVDYRTFLKFAMPRARYRWLLIVDCDERVSLRLRREIRDRVDKEGGGFDGFRMLRVNHFLGRRIRHGGWDGDFIYRFFRKGRGGPREREVHPGIVIDGRIEALDGPILHFPYPTLEDYFAKFNRYTSAAARDRIAAGRSVRWIDRFLAPPLRFFKTYVLQLGFLDGYPGFVLACLSFLYVFVRYTKMWQIQNAERIALANQRLAEMDEGGGARAPLRPPRH